MQKSKINVLAAPLLAIFTAFAWANCAQAITLFTTGVDDTNFQSAYLSDGTLRWTQDFTLSSKSSITSIRWSGLYCNLSGSGCLKTGYDGLTDNVFMEISGVGTFPILYPIRSADLNWSSVAAVIEHTVLFGGLVLDAGDYTFSVWNDLNLNTQYGWYWTSGGASGTDFSLTINGTYIAPVPLPLSGLLLLGGIGMLGLFRARQQAK